MKLSLIILIPLAVGASGGATYIWPRWSAAFVVAAFVMGTVWMLILTGGERR